MTEDQKQLAALYAVGALSPKDSETFEKSLSSSPELSRETGELLATAANFVRLIPATSPPSDSKANILAAIGKKPDPALLASQSSNKEPAVFIQDSTASQDQKKADSINPYREPSAASSSTTAASELITTTASIPQQKETALPSKEQSASASSSAEETTVSQIDTHPATKSETPSVQVPENSASTPAITPTKTSSPTVTPRLKKISPEDADPDSLSPADSSKTPHPLPQPAPSSGSGWAILAWLFIIGLSISTAWLWTERNRLQQHIDSGEQEVRARELLVVREQQQAALQNQLEQSQDTLKDLSSELEKWQKKSVLTSMQISKLDGTTEPFRYSIAIAVWDPIANQGILILEGLPQPEEGTDYQLWVVDPKKKDPINAGVLNIEYDGSARLDFKPQDPIETITKYHISIEKKGGVETAEGPIVMIGP